MLLVWSETNISEREIRYYDGQVRGDRRRSTEICTPHMPWYSDMSPNLHPSPFTLTLTTGQDYCTRKQKGAIDLTRASGVSQKVWNTPGLLPLSHRRSTPPASSLSPTGDRRRARHRHRDA